MAKIRTSTLAPTAAPVLSVRHLTKSFTLHAIDGRTVAGLRGVDLDLGPAEHVALAGSSGAGKSSLLKCVYRTYLPTAGSVWLRTGDDRRIELTALTDHEMAELRAREMGYVSQFLRAEPRRSTLDTVARAGVRRGLALDEARSAATDALGRLGIGPALWATHPTLLSGGEKQRVNLAVGTVAPPRLLLLDEPVSALDPANRRRALDLIADLTSAGVTVLAVFHDREAMVRLAHRVVRLEDGRVVDAGRPEDVLRSRRGGGAP